jgi:hypothetical protein
LIILKRRKPNEQRPVKRNAMRINRYGLLPICWPIIEKIFS